jgi:gliding-associated putative ABC transporter substrate-binding component GldG
MTSKQSTYFKQSIIVLGSCLLFGLAYLLASYFPLRMDLTADKRYSLHTSTRALVQALEAPLQVDIYLAGDLPTAFQQLQHSLCTLLEECQAYAKHAITYRLVDINQIPLEERKVHFQTLIGHGIQPTNVYKEEGGERTEKLICPGIILTYQDQSVGVGILKANRMLPVDMMVHQSIENLEYEVGSLLARLVQQVPLRIGIIEGHGGPKAAQLQGCIQVLQRQYVVAGVTLAGDLTGYAALLMIKPQQAFSEVEKYQLDQYIMGGGKVLFFIDRLQICMEHVAAGSSLALPLELNLDDQLFRYGVRINQDLIQDLQCGIYPIIVGKLGNQPQLQFLPWPFFPILNHFAEHVITKNMNAVYTQFINSMDPIEVQGVVQTPLLYSSPHSIRSGMPVYVDLEALRKPPNKALYQQGPIPVAYLLEGEFTSLYKHRLLPEGVDGAACREQSRPTKLLVVSGSSILLNAVSPKDGQPLPLGYDPFLQQHFANPDFISHSLAYMLADYGMINARSKTLKLRLVDSVKVKAEKLYWQWLNVAVPLMLLMVLGSFAHVLRRRR